MPSAYQRSRDFMTQAVARVRSGATSALNEYGRRIDQPGPEVQVEPFRAGEVTTPAALIKLGTSIAAARRSKANYQQALQDVELEREKARAGVSLLRAQTGYYGRRPAAGAGTAAKTIIDPRTGKETTPAQFNAKLASDRDKRAAETHGRTMATAGKVGAARARLADIDKAAARDVERITENEMATRYRDVLERASAGDPGALRFLRINPEGFKGLLSNEKLAALKAGEADLRARVKATTHRRIEQYYLPERQRFQQIITAGALGAGEEEPAAGDDFLNQPALEPEPGEENAGKDIFYAPDSTGQYVRRR